ncbi:E3 ubiquitin-protein ligase PUB22 [Hibiscus syriacus]|uniref:U-box domain-containing protein n=1 Tax=Hibiscus syriacus TaxID=106335 RepID=A0A6A2ZM91_HIBSY|nr:E3 ubiquitin-protein ligase PUB22-like [Hibiscus syriacus]KAE8692988.1 E3 ubiquitin-protein ligase PUB22 [Hibiscus syriacus]
MDEIEIPSHFLCPISLQLMRDPVTISTGITYDRESIEQWLFSFKNMVCPVTKQVLHELDLTPNHTLRRLIQAWCTLNASHGIERIPTPKPPINKTQIVKLIQDANKFPEMQVRCLKILRSITLESERNRSCLEAAGAVEFLVSIIKSYDSSLLLEIESNEGSEVIKAGDEALSILYHIKVSGSCLKSIVSSDNGFVESLLIILKKGSYQSRAYATMLLKEVFEVADPIHLISLRPEFFAEIVRTLRDQISLQASKAALKLLVELCPWGRNRIKAVEGGAVFVIVELLLQSSDKRTSELALVVLDQLCGCAEGRAEFLNHGAGLAMVSKKIFRVSHAGSERAVRILLSICRFSATSRVLQEMLQVGVVAKLCLVLQLDSTYKTKEKAREILKLHARVWRNHACIPSHLLSSYPSSS